MIRDSLSIEERSLPLEHTIDPGFVHQRKIQTIIGDGGMNIIDQAISRLPDLPAWEKELRIDHIYKDVFLKFCDVNGVKSLEALIAEGGGRLFCSTEELAPCEDVYNAERAVSVWVPRGECQRRVEFHYSPKLVKSDTLRGQLHQGDKNISIAAELHEVTEDCLKFHPIIMGSPWLRTYDQKREEKIMWWHYEFFENFVEDFDEFSKVRDFEKPKNYEPMRHISEKAFKRALASILGGKVPTDWGGETSDYFTSHLHLDGKRVTAAFLLKGPANFTPMALNHLGKNNDQIVRLSQEPANVLIVQHCHEILPPVRSTLRAFAVQPYGSRRYCLIDGRDSLWLLQAYDLYDKALEWSTDA